MSDLSAINVVARGERIEVERARMLVDPDVTASIFVARDARPGAVRAVLEKVLANLDNILAMQRDATDDALDRWSQQW